MPAKKVSALTDPIWPDRTIYAGVFADQPPTPAHRQPLSTDPSWNEMVDWLQDPSAGHTHTGSGTGGIKVNHGFLLNVLATQHGHGHQPQGATGLFGDSTPQTITTTV